MQEQAARSAGHMEAGRHLSYINEALVKGIKECATKTVGIKSNIKRSSHYIITSKPEVAKARRELMKSRKEMSLLETESTLIGIQTVRMGKMEAGKAKEEKAAALRGLGEESVYKQQQAEMLVKKMKNKYIASVKKAKDLNHKRDIQRTKGMTNAEKSKFLHSRIKRSAIAKAEAFPSLSLTVSSGR